MTRTWLLPRHRPFRGLRECIPGPSMWAAVPGGTTEQEGWPSGGMWQIHSLRGHLPTWYVLAAGGMAESWRQHLSTGAEFQFTERWLLEGCGPRHSMASLCPLAGLCLQDAVFCS